MDLILQTERLLMRQILPEDAENMFELDNNPNVMKYLGGKTITDIDVIHNTIKRIRNEYQTNGIARFSVILKETNEFIGWSGIQFVTQEENNHINYYDLGYRFQEQHWGKGYGYESALPWVEYAKNKMKIDTLTAGAHVANAGSNRILSKLGMTLINEYDWEGNPWNWYELKF